MGDKSSKSNVSDMLDEAIKKTQADDAEPVATTEEEVLAAADAAFNDDEADTDELRQQLAALTEKLKDSQEQSLRSRAELDNTRKRLEKELLISRQYALEGFMKELLQVLDSLEQGIGMADPADEALKGMREGMELTLQMLLKVLADKGAVEINPEGEPFDPVLHEAMTMQESEESEGTVLTVVQKGYKLHERVLRPARVIVAK